jgi:hypothetical protein
VTEFEEFAEFEALEEFAEFEESEQFAEFDEFELAKCDGCAISSNISSL